jgi:hypothetical protein
VNTGRVCTLSRVSIGRPLNGRDKQVSLIDSLRAVRDDRHSATLNDRLLLRTRSIAIVNRRVLSLGMITVIQETDMTQSLLSQHKITQERTVMIHMRKVKATRQIPFVLPNAAIEHSTAASSSSY